MEDSVNDRSSTDDRSSTPHTVEFNLNRAAKYIEEASSADAHIVCLPETVTTNGVPNSNGKPEVSNTWTSFFQEQAGKHSIAVIAPFFVSDGKNNYNQATVINASEK